MSEVQNTPEQTTTEETTTVKKGFFKTLLDNVTENVKEGASFVGEKASIVGEKVAETSAKAYVASSELVSETSDKIHDFTEKQSLHKEETKIEKRQIELKHTFGVLSFDYYLINDNLHKPFLTSESIVAIVSEFNANELRLTEIALEIKEIENH